MLANGPTIGIKALRAADWHLALPTSISGIGLFMALGLGLWMARRAGIPKERILNFRPLDELTIAFK